VNPTDLEVAVFVSQAFGENAFVVRRKQCPECVVIDPGLESEAIVGHLEAHQLVPEAILNTHGHGDHIAGNAALKARWPDCRLVIGAGDADKLTDPRLNLSLSFGFELVSPPADATVEEGDVCSAAGIDFHVLAIPGHSRGHVVFFCRDHQPWLVFVGDVIFAGGIGRTDFPDGSMEQLTEGIHAKLFAMPDDAVLLPGHGPTTTVGREKRSNPFVGFELEN
jgi:glyoxylase-like metal-dependent hydrolase (beta-lactamase superfamily II)